MSVEGENGFCSFEVMVVDSKDDALFVRANTEVVVNSVKYSAFVCNSRLEAGFLKQVQSKDGLWCSSIALPESRVETPFDLSWWRGGRALIGSLVTLKTKD